MMAKKAAHLRSRQNVLGTTLARIVGKGASGSHTRFVALQKWPLLYRWAPRPAALAPDLVSLAIFAIDRVGPAAVRACASGVEVHVAAPDEATAAIFRAALAETARRRGTDRLIRIVVD